MPHIRFTRLILRHAHKLLPLQRDLRGETALEVCATHGDHESVAVMLAFLQVRQLGGCLCGAGQTVVLMMIRNHRNLITRTPTLVFPWPRYTLVFCVVTPQHCTHEPPLCHCPSPVRSTIIHRLSLQPPRLTGIPSCRKFANLQARLVCICQSSPCRRRRPSLASIRRGLQFELHP